MTREIYYDIIYKKTAALLGACGATGAISVGADEEHVNRMREFGNNLGVAFQIKDDILDYSPMEVTGKPTGGDMRERKITLPLLYVLEQSTPAERDLLLAKLSDVRNSPDHVEYLCRAVERGGGLTTPGSAWPSTATRRSPFWKDTPIRTYCVRCACSPTSFSRGTNSRSCAGLSAAAAPKRGPGPEARL